LELINELYYDARPNKSQDMHQVVIELSYVDCLLVPVDVGFLVEVIRIGL